MESTSRSTQARSRVRYAVVGLGNIAQVAVLPSFEHASGNSELVALVSSDSVKLDEVGKRYAVAHRGSYDELERILEESSADAVYLAVPNSVHRDLTLRAAKAGVHVLCEKPMAMSSADCEAMIDACRGAGVFLMIAYRLHFEEATLRAIELVRDGRLGEPRFFSSVFSQQVRPNDVRTRSSTGGGALFDIGIYCVNAARNLFADEPVEVMAMSATGEGTSDRDVDAMTSVLLRFPGNRFAQLTVNQAASDTDEFRIVGTKGDLRVEPAYTYTGDIVHHLTVDGQRRTTIFSQRDQFGPEIVTFSRCIRDGVEPEASGEEGLLDIRVLEAIARSAREGRPIQLAPRSRGRRPDLSQELRMPKITPPLPVHAPSPSR